MEETCNKNFKAGTVLIEVPA